MSATSLRALKIIVIVAIACVIAAFFAFHLDRYLTMQSLKENESWMHDAYRDHFLETIAAYCLAAFTWVLCAMPAATIIMLLAGALFGPLVGTIVCVLSTSLGAVMSLLISRFVLRDSVRKHFAKQAAIVEREYAKNGTNYLIAMRLIPVLPYFLTNLVFGLTTIRPGKFWITSMIASIPAIAIYATAGSELSKITKLEDILSVRLIVAFVALACLPFVGRYVTKKILRPRS